MTQLAERSSNPYQSPTSLTDDFSDELNILNDLSKDAKIRALEEYIEILNRQLYDIDVATLLLFLGITIIAFFVGLNLGN